MSKEADEVITTKEKRNIWLHYDQFGYWAEKKTLSFLFFVQLVKNNRQFCRWRVFLDPPGWMTAFYFGTVQLS